MSVALGLARRGLGCTAPNPPVGCVIVKDGSIVGRGWTQPGGRPHAETEALHRAGAAAAGAEAFVTLEPCAHHGRTPPCCDALIAAGIARCVVALTDPDPRVDGEGMKRMRAAGIAVETGLLAEESAEVTAGFLSRVQRGRPLVTLKLATSLDGRIATSTGESKWITGPEARARAHLLRAEHDAILVGSGTALSDDPRLDVRLPGLGGRRPLRVVLDRRLRLPLSHGLVRDARDLQTLLLTSEDAPEEQARAYQQAGVNLQRVPCDETGELSLSAVLTGLGEQGMNRVMVEGGAAVAAAFLKADLVDRLAWFRAPIVLGGDGLAAPGALGIENLARAPRFRRNSIQALGLDLLETFARNA